MQIKAPQKIRSRPNLAPLIDVVFLLLIFFLLTTALSSDRFKVELPKSESMADPDADAITVLVGRNDDIAIANQAVPREELSAVLRQHAGSPEQAATAKLLIKSDGEADADDILDIIEAAKQIGLRRVTIATAKK